MRTTYALKWDARHGPHRRRRGPARATSRGSSRPPTRCSRSRGCRSTSGRTGAFLDTGLRNCEPWAWPNRPGFSFAKALDWELPLWGADVATLTLPDWGCVELKHLDADEFGHWSHTDFAGSARTRRKAREWAVFHALAGDGTPPPGVVEIVAPAGADVVEHVRADWLPARAAGTLSAAR